MQVDVFCCSVSEVGVENTSFSQAQRGEKKDSKYFEVLASFFPF